MIDSPGRRSSDHDKETRGENDAHFNRERQRNSTAIGALSRRKANYNPNAKVGEPYIADRTLTSPSPPAPAATYKGTK